jgi:hypothetical protein
MSRLVEMTEGKVRELVGPVAAEGQAAAAEVDANAAAAAVAAAAATAAELAGAAAGGNDAHDSAMLRCVGMSSTHV